MHAHAAITGKSVTDFGRAVLLRCPRPRRRGISPSVVALTERQVAQWQDAGAQLNDVAHRMNARDELQPAELFHVLPRLRALVATSFATLLTSETPPPYVLAPSARHHLRKVGVNLVQIKTRCYQLGLEPPAVLIGLLARIRMLMNGEQGPHGP